MHVSTEIRAELKFVFQNVGIPLKLGICEKPMLNSEKAHFLRHADVRGKNTWVDRFAFVHGKHNQYVRSRSLKKNVVEYSVPEVVQPPPPLWQDVAGEPILLPSLRDSEHYYWGVRIW